MSPNLMRSLIFRGFDLDEQPDGSFAISRAGKVIATTPTLEHARARVNAEKEKESNK
jgi:hypothetical protein